MSQMPAIQTILAKAGLRPTAKRVALAKLLFDGVDKHVTADDVMEMVRRKRLRVSQATVYNSLNQFCAAGLLKRIVIDSSSTVFDTNTSHHHHLFYEDDGHIVDLAGDSISLLGLPDLAEHESLLSVDLILRVGRAHD
ncbi:MAG TPA: transcriptional repressor [Hyphomicrobiales bacterium]|nr:transcriptional repressor [Hyphomicrobiales bacterium]